jgi:hypothetical protein
VRLVLLLAGSSLCIYTECHSFLWAYLCLPYIPQIVRGSDGNMIRIDTTTSPTVMHDYTDISNNSRPSQVCGGCGSDVLFGLKFIQDRNLKIERFEVGSDSVRLARQTRNKIVIYLTYGIQFWCINTRWKDYSEHFPMAPVSHPNLFGVNRNRQNHSTFRICHGAASPYYGPMGRISS